MDFVPFVLFSILVEAVGSQAQRNSDEVDALKSEIVRYPEGREFLPAACILLAPGNRTIVMMGIQVEFLVSMMVHQQETDREVLNQAAFGGNRRPK